MRGKNHLQINQVFLLNERKKETNEAKKKPTNTFPKPGTLLNKARSPKRLVGLDAGLLAWVGCCWTSGLLRMLAAALLSAITDEAGKCCITGAMPALLQFDADELPDVVDSVSALFVPAALAITPPESSWDRKPRLINREILRRLFNTQAIASFQYDYCAKHMIATQTNDLHSFDDTKSS